MCLGGDCGGGGSEEIRVGRREREGRMEATEVGRYERRKDERNNSQQKIGREGGKE